MTVYRDARHCIARVMSIETRACTAQSGWQMRYQSGYPDLPRDTSGLSAEEMLTQDAMTRAMLRRELSGDHWHALIAKYSINVHEVSQSVGWLIPRVVSPAHHLFKTKAVTAWVVPRRLPDGFYVLHSWDNNGTPESTLRRWRSGVFRWLASNVDEAHKRVEELLKEQGLIMGEAA